MDYAGEPGLRPAHCVNFYFPMGSLSTAYPVGAYPFGPVDRVSEWQTEVDSFLTQVANWIHGTVPFDFALIGFEVNASSTSQEELRANGIPKDRDNGILWNAGFGLNWLSGDSPIVAQPSVRTQVPELHASRLAIHLSSRGVLCPEIRISVVMNIPPP
jgi:hypothetical protein